MIQDGRGNRMSKGLYAGGRRYVGDPRGGRLTEAHGVEQRAPLLDSEEYDPGDD